MFRVLEVAADDPPRISEGESLVGPPADGTLRWIDLEAQTDADLGLLRKRFDFHPLALEDCANFDQRPKLEEYGTYLFIVVHGFRANSEAKALGVQPLEVHAFLGHGYLVTIHQEPLPELATTWERVAGDAVLARKGTDFIYYLLVDAIVDANFQLLDLLSEAFDDLEDEVLNQTKRESLERIFSLKKTLVTMRKVLSPQRDVLAILAKRGHSCIAERTSFYFRDVYDHLVRIYESIDAGRDLLGNVLDAYLSMVAQRTNEVMKQLTVLSAIFLPLAFVVGFFGMNFESLPFKNDAIMWAVIVSCAIIPGAMVAWFRLRKWF